MSKIVFEQVTKKFGKTLALDDINLRIESNKIYGLLGRNGAGKTTLLNLVTNKLFPTKGEILIDGENVIENDYVLNKVFYMLEKNLYPMGISVERLINRVAYFYPSFDKNYAFRLCNKFKLNIAKKLKSLSTGYISICKDIIALASNVEIIIFDEPVLGLDANHRDMFYKELIGNYIKQPKTIIISSHLVEEVADIIEEVIIIKEGRIIVQDSVEQLLAQTYNISGEGNKIDCYLKNKKYIGMDEIGKFKQAIVLENMNHDDKILVNELDLEVNKIELQNLFIKLTN